MMNFLTPAGEAAVAAYDPFKDDPTFRCDPVAIRRVWGAPGTPLSITRERTASCCATSGWTSCARCT